MTGKDKIYGADRFAGDSGFENGGYLELTPGKPVSAHFQVGEDLSSSNTSELLFRLHVWDMTDYDETIVRLNQEPLADLKSAASGQTANGGRWLECRTHPAQVKRGELRVELAVSKRDESRAAPTLDAVQLHVYHGIG